jgi:Glycosyltransferase family 87
LAQVLAGFYQMAGARPLLGFATETQGWTVATYFYQCGQFLQVILAYYLMLSLAQKLGLQPFAASLLVAALFLFNYPLVRTLTFDQVNLWLLNSFLLGVVLLRRHTLWAGLAVAVGAHIKLYTLILLLPWALTRRWRAIASVILGFVVLPLIQTRWGHDLTLWQQFLAYFSSPEKPSNYRNNGLWSLIVNLVKIPGRFLPSDVFFNLVPLVVAAVTLLIFVWFVGRAIQREKMYACMGGAIIQGESHAWNYMFRFYGHSIDAIALSLLCSPSVWEHHYVIALPVALWAIVTRRYSQPWLAVLGTFLIFCIPTFEIFPLSFHRLTGLLILVYTTAPAMVQPYFVKQRDQLPLLENEAHLPLSFD